MNREILFPAIAVPFALFVAGIVNPSLHQKLGEKYSAKLHSY